MVSHSHARCRQCGRARHRSARFNLCESCWKELKPSIRAGWRDVKERRQLRLVGASVVMEIVPNGTVWDRIRGGNLSKDERDELITQIREEGLPPANTQERGLYLSLFRKRAGDPIPEPVPVAEPEPEPELESEPEPEPEPEPVLVVRGRKSRLTPEQLAEIAALYADHANSLEDIKRTYGIGDSTIYTAIRRAGIPKRSGRQSQAIAVITPPRYAVQHARWKVSFTVVREVEIDGVNVYDALRQAGEQYGEGLGLNVVKVEQL